MAGRLIETTPGGCLPGATSSSGALAESRLRRPDARTQAALPATEASEPGPAGPGHEIDRILSHRLFAQAAGPRALGWAIYLTSRYVQTIDSRGLNQASERLFSDLCGRCAGTSRSSSDVLVGRPAGRGLRGPGCRGLYPRPPSRAQDSGRSVASQVSPFFRPSNKPQAEA